MWEERKRIATVSLRLPFADAVLARKLRDQLGLPCLPRTVAYCRRALGIPHWRQRAAQGCYLLATTRFSNLYPLNRRTIHDVAPRDQGIYELRLDHGVLSYSLGVCPIFYIGSAKNLRKWLLAHLATKSHNRCVAARVRDGGALFRFVAVPARWRAEERRGYERFAGTFGAPPRCNASRP